MTEQEKYTTYSFEDFLQDDFFRESIKRPTEETVAFWNNFLENYPEQSDKYHAVRRFFEDLTRTQISEQEGAEMWTGILNKYKLVRERTRIKRIAYYSMAVAASIAVLLVARIFFVSQDVRSVRNDIMAFVDSRTDAVNNSGEVQLLLSEQKTIALKEKESVITYDSTGIHANSEKISKNEIDLFNQLTVPYAKSSVLTLHDGTKIWVNADTKLVYPVEFEKDKREIYVNGEIFLDVAHDAQRPFIVRTGDFRIQVVGTRFNVQAYASDEQSRIALESGSVKIITENNDDVLLSPNTMYEQDKNGNSSVKDADIRKYTSWIHGLYMYESERLDVILKRLERHYGTEIVFDPSVSEIRCSGKLDLKENLEDVLSTISMAALVEYVKDGESYIISYQPP